MWLTSTTISHPDLPSTGNGQGLTDPTLQEAHGFVASRWPVWIVLVGLLFTTVWSQRVQAQATITIAKKAQSETAGQTFGFTSDIPGGNTFNLTDNAAYIPVQDVGVGNNNKVWVTTYPASGTGQGPVYFHAPGSTSWTATPVNSLRIDADQNGIAYLINSSGQVFTYDGTTLTNLPGTGAVDVGVSAGTAQPIYMTSTAGGSPGCPGLYQWNGSSFVGITGACGSQLDVAPDGTIWILNGAVLSHISVSGTTATVIANYSGAYEDVTVAADGTVWATAGGVLYRLVSGSFISDPNSGGFFKGLSAGSDGDAPFLSNYNAKFRLVQRNENDTYIDDHTVNTTNANTVTYNVAPGTYTITENAPPSPWQLTNIITAGGTATPNIAGRSVTFTVAAGQAGYVEFDNANVISSVVSNACGAPYVETFGTAGTTTPTVGSALPNGYTAYHYITSTGTGIEGAGNYSIYNDLTSTGFAANAGKIDHTPGDVGGYMMVINGGFGPDEFFRRRFSGLVPGATYFLSLWAENITSSIASPNLILEARKTDGTILASYTSGDIAYDGVTWHKYQVEFTADASGTVDFIVRNNQQILTLGGNDLAIDDITIGVGCDFGDAPDTYKTTLASGGPSHKGSANLRMGLLLDIETDGFPSTANGDNLDNINDEDAVTFGVLCTATTSLTALVVNVNNTGAPTAKIIGWIDFNQNGIFEASEGATIPAGTAGSYTLTWTGITGLVPGTTYARVRLTSDPTITVNTPGGSASDGEVEDYQIVINPGGGTITANPTALTTCSGGPVSVSYTTSPVGQTVQWVRMPGGLTGAGNFTDFPTALGTTPVSYTYTAVIPSIFGCPSNTVTTVVTVNPQPTITPSQCAQTICSGQTGAITFTSNIPGETIHWVRTPTTPAPSSGTGNIGQSLTNTGPASLTYTYTIWADYAGTVSCATSNTITCVIVVDPCCQLVASAASTTATQVCPAGTITLTASTTGAVGTLTYNWTGPNYSTTTNLATVTIPNATVSHTGMYTLVVTDNGVANCTKIDSVYIAVSPLSASAESNSPQCQGNTLQLNAFGPETGTFTYLWIGPNGFSSTAQNPTIPNSTTAATGSYSVVVTDTQSGCSGTAVTAVTIATQPNLVIAAAPSQTICSGQSSTITVSGSNGANVTWSNNFGQNGTGTSINTGVLTNFGTQPIVLIYEVTASAGGGTCSDVTTFSVVVLPVPVIQVIPTASVVCNLEQTSVKATAYPATAVINWTRTPATNPPASGSGTGTVSINETLPPDNYTYQFTATQGGCTSPVQNVSVTVQQ